MHWLKATIMQILLASCFSTVRAKLVACSPSLKGVLDSGSCFQAPPLLPRLQSNLRATTPLGPSRSCPSLGLESFGRRTFSGTRSVIPVPVHHVHQGRQRNGVRIATLCVPPEFAEDPYPVPEGIDLSGWDEPGLRTKKYCFDIEAPFEATGDQPEAIESILKRLEGGHKFTVLRGATGTGKTFAVAQTVQRFGKPTLILCHNKTLAAQLARELRAFFPRNSVELFVSYYNFYQPEAYIATSDTYISKISSINQELDALRHRATRSVFERDDVIVVASVSCIYGLGLPTNYLNARLELATGESLSMEAAELALRDILYQPTEGALSELARGEMAVSHAVQSSDIIVWPPYEDEPLRLSFVEGRLHRIEKLASFRSVDRLSVYPARHHVTPKEQLERACELIEAELEEQLAALRAEDNAAAAAKLEQRTRHDLEQIRETGYCQGMENYSRHLAGRHAGEAPDTLVDYLSGAFGSNGWLLVIDESHVTIPQLKGMCAADRSRKENLVRHGFRLPSALDNRPLNDAEFWSKIKQGLFVSATPGDREVLMASEEEDAGDSSEGAGSAVVDMVIRPTNVLDPEIEVWPKEGQLAAILAEVRARTRQGEKALVMALTKKDAEDLAGWLLENGIAAKYLHSGLTTVQRAEVLEELQRGQLEVLVGVNLLREGLDLPQVSLVVIMDADKEGFLRSERSLIQTIGRAARNARGKAVFVADKLTPSMQRCIDETYRRRRKQAVHNERHGLAPTTAKGREVRSLFEIEREAVDGELEATVEWTRWRPGSEEVNGVGGESRAINDEPRVDGKEQAGQWDEAAPGVAKGGVSGPLLGRARATGAAVSTDGRVLGGSGGGLEGERVKEDAAKLGALRDAARQLPSKTGVYMWMSKEGGEVLYVGKAKSLRTRVMSYVKEGAVGAKIRALRGRAGHIDYVLTPGGEHDALLLEGRLIKEHRPPYNVLLKDDKFYPYVCVTLGDEYPTIFSVHRRDTSRAGARYFGPFTNVGHLKASLQLLESAFSLRSLRFQARHGLPVPREEYLAAVDQCVRVLEGNGVAVARELEAEGRVDAAQAVRSIVGKSDAPRRELDFLGWPADSPACDVAAAALVAGAEGGGERGGGVSCVVQVMQLREGLVKGRFSFVAEVPGSFDDADIAEATEVALEQFYLNAEEAEAPELVLTHLELPDKGRIRQLLRHRGAGKVTVRRARQRGKGAEMDRRAVELAGANAAAEAERLSTRVASSDKAAEELAGLLGLESAPRRIEAFDISHLQGQGTVASRVVFINGEPAKGLYRTYNIRSVDGSPDDYASIEEAVFRRFRDASPASGAELDEGSQLPDLVLIDGGKGQLSAAMRGLEAAGCGGQAICALAKREEEVFVPGRRAPLQTKAEQKALLLLRAARDESHRFALMAHRRRRRAATFGEQRRAGRGRGGGQRGQRQEPEPELDGEAARGRGGQGGAVSRLDQAR